MPSILSDEDKETVKRVIPKQSNKIHAVAVARLYVAYPNKSKWTYTGLQGAIVLADDLVGHTYWLKMVDVSVSQSPGPRSCPPIAHRTSSRLAEESFGITRSTTPGSITRIEPFSILSNSRNAWQACRLWMRRRPSSSRRRWTRGKGMPAKLPETLPSADTANLSSRAAYSEASLEDIGMPLLPRRQSLLKAAPCRRLHHYILNRLLPV